MALPSVLILIISNLVVISIIENANLANRHPYFRNFGQSIFTMGGDSQRHMQKKYDKQFLQDLYQVMMTIRLTEESFVEPILSKEVLCPVHLYSGQEAIAAGLCANLHEDDHIFGSHRSHGHYLAKGGDLREMVAEIYGRATGCAKGRGGSMHLVSPEKGVMGIVPIVGGTVALALGSALSFYIKNEKRVTVSFFGDGAVGEGVVAESLNFAALMKLPIIFACENNFYSTHLPISECRKSNIDIVELAKPFGIVGMKVDGNDVLSVYEASAEAVNLCRAGQGPVLMEFITYRMRGHVGPDDNIQGTRTDIRPKAEIEQWRKKDPMQCFSSYLQENGFATAQELHTIEKEVEQQIVDAHNFAKKSPFPSGETVAHYVFKQ